MPAARKVKAAITNRDCCPLMRWSPFALIRAKPAQITSRIGIELSYSCAPNVMNAERWERIKQLYDEAQARSPAARAAFLAQACAGDEALHRDVQTLLDQPIGTDDLRAVM